MQINSLAAAGVIGLGSLVPGCSALDLANRLTPTRGLSIQRDLAYGEGPRQRLDVYTPTDKATPPPAKGYPIVVFIYGGSWQSGEKNDYLFAAQAFASQGYVTVVPDYRLYPEVTYPGFLEDSAEAVAYTMDHAEAWGGDRSTVFLVGHSAGAYNVVMLAVDTPFLKERGVERSELAGVVGLAGPCDFLPTQSAALKQIFMQVPDPALTQPVNRVAGDIPPMLLLHGEDDEIVRLSNTRTLAAALDDQDSVVEKIYYPGYDHIDIISALAVPLRNRRSVMGDIEEWMERVTEDR